MSLLFFTKNQPEVPSGDLVWLQHSRTRKKADLLINKVYQVVIKGRNKIYITSVFKGFKYTHQENMSVKCIPPYTPLLYSKAGVCRGIPIFLIFAPKHRLWVLVRTASARRF